MKEIANAVGTPIDIDGPTRNRMFGHCVRILVDIDLSKRAYDEILVEREGFAFKVEVQYERRPLFCHHGFSIGHNVSTCRWIHPQAAKDNNDRGKQSIVADEAPSKQTRQQHGGATSTLANGGTWTWVPGSYYFYSLYYSKGFSPFLIGNKFSVDYDSHSIPCFDVYYTDGADLCCFFSFGYLSNGCSWFPNTKGSYSFIADFRRFFELFQLSTP